MSIYFDNDYYDNGEDDNGIYFCMEKSSIDGDESLYILRVIGNDYLEGVEMGTEEERNENLRLMLRLERMTDSLIEILNSGGDFSGIIIIFEDRNACKSIRAWLSYFLWIVSIARTGYIDSYSIFSNATFTFHTSISILECNDPDNGPCFIIYPDDVVDNEIIFFDDSINYMVFDQNGYIKQYELGEDNVSKLIQTI